jgi:peptidoglycan/LPS O-acetylase OafA/YrhL
MLFLFQKNSTRQWDILRIMLGLFVCIGSGVIWYLLSQQPQSLRIDLDKAAQSLTDKNELYTKNPIIGSLGSDPDGVWVGSAAQIVLNRHTDFPWRVATMRWQQVPGNPITVGLDVGLQHYMITTAPHWQKISLLLPKNMPTAQIALTAPTRKFVHDNRDLSMIIAQLTITRLTMVSFDFWLMVVGYLLPLWCIAVIVRRTGWIGFGVFVVFMLVHLFLVFQESTTGFAYRSLWLDGYGRWMFVPIAAYSLLAQGDAHTQTIPHGRRVLGLDILRSFAIIGVIISHAVLVHGLWDNDPSTYVRMFNLINSVGGIGVNVFFALSGYLIGGILLRKLLELGNGSVIRRFWYRRWLRTLPAAYVSAIVSFFIIPTNDWMSFLVSALFLGSMNPLKESNELGHWWSLSIEEFFYFLFPVLIYIFLKKIAPRRAFLVAAAIFIVVTIINKITWQFVLPVHILLKLPKRFLWNNLDLIVWGVLLAYIQLHKPTWLTNIRKSGIFPGALLIFIGYIIVVDYPRWFELRYYGAATLATLGATLMIPALLRIHTVGNKYLDSAFQWCAQLSYSLYLYNFVALQITRAIITRADSWLLMSVSIVLYLGISIGLALLSYVFIEKPVLRWRDSHVVDH